MLESAGLPISAKTILPGLLRALALRSYRLWVRDRLA